MKTSILAVSAATLLAIGLTGCVGTTASSAPGDKPSNASETTPSFAPEPSAEPELPDTLPFGNAVSYDDGLAVSISEPVPFTPGEYAAGGALPHNVKFTVTITNGTEANYEGYTLITVTSGGAAGEQVFDSANGLAGPPSGVILPGQTISFESGFNIADPAAIVMSVAPGFEYEDAIFTNVAG